MWLINTTTLQLHENPSPSEYAILTHTWDAEEVSFRDMEDLEKASKKHGFHKIAKTCEVAKAAGIRWAWVDTCCIDKSSSAELTESINSMWRWYHEARICYAFISDLSIPSSTGESSFAHGATAEDLGRCRWFTRGWTLQELLASNNIIFFARTWESFGTKESLRGKLSTVTGIYVNVLADSRLMHQIPTACRMSWAANRETTREEDRAYSLFGIFDVNLPLIYGEGAKAFTRLQEAILQNSTDLSLFAWDAGDEDQLYTGLLARSPSDFADCGRVQPCSNLMPESLCDIQMTNKGISLTAGCMKLVGKPMNPDEPGDSWEEFSGPMAKPYVPGIPPKTRGQLMHLIDLEHDLWDGLCIFRIYLVVFQTPHFFVRQRRKLVWPAIEDGIPGRLTYQIPRYISTEQSRRLASDHNHIFSVNTNVASSSRCTLQSIECYPPSVWNPAQRTITTYGANDFLAVFSVRLEEVVYEDGALQATQEQLAPFYYPVFKVVVGLKAVDTENQQPQPWLHLPTQSEPVLSKPPRDSLSWKYLSRDLPPVDLWDQEYPKLFNQRDFTNSSGPYTLKPEVWEEESVLGLPRAKHVAQNDERLKRSVDVTASVDTYRDEDGVSEHEVTIFVASALKRLRGPIVIGNLGLDKLL